MRRYFLLNTDVWQEYKDGKQKKRDLGGNDLIERNYFILFTMNFFNERN